MRYVIAMLTLGFVLVLGGCIPSLHPLYTDKDLVFDPALLGEWADQKSKESLTFTPRDKNEYKLVFTNDSGEKNPYITRLVKLDGKLFLDVASDLSAECNCLCMPVHLFFLISQVEPTLRMWDFNDKWLETFLKKNPSALNHEFIDNDLLLTASTKRLQTFFLRHLNTKDAFTSPADYVRKR